MFGQKLCLLQHPRRFPIPKLNIGSPRKGANFSMGHAGASRKSPHDAPWEMLSLSKPISALLLRLGAPVRYLHTPGSCSITETRTLLNSHATVNCQPPALHLPTTALHLPNILWDTVPLPPSCQTYSGIRSHYTLNLGFHSELALKVTGSMAS